MNKETLIADFPACEVYERAPRAEYHYEFSKSVEAIDISVEDTLGLARRGYYSKFSPGSVVRYAQQYGECPIKAVERAKERNQKLWWLNQDASVISSHCKSKAKVIAIRVGQKVRFEGCYFEIVAEPNNNLGLKEVEA